MNYLDIILWVSAICLWIWIIVKICDSFLHKGAEQRMLKDAQFNRISALEKEHLNLVMGVRFKIMKRLDAIEAKLKKGKR